MKLKLLLTFITTIYLCTAFSQNQLNYYDILENKQNEINTLRSSQSRNDQKKVKQFDRWANFWKDHIYPDGSFPSPIHNLEVWKEIQNTAQLKSLNAGGAWSYVGPTQIPTASVPYYAGKGRLNTIAFNGTNTTTMYVGAPSGGVWKTTDGGTNWSPLTDNLPNLGVSHIVLHPTNANIVYIATGDYDSSLINPPGDTSSFGVMKSTDGGATWNTTGLTSTVQSGVHIAKLLIDPNNTNTIFATNRNSIKRSTDGGTNWTDVHTENGAQFNDIQYKTGSSTIIFATAANGAFYKSTNNGTSWTKASSPSSSRLDMALTAANPNLIVTVDNGGVVRKSTNDGTSWTTASTVSGHDPQGGYNQTIAISPINENLIIIGGIEMYRSTNGGTSFTKYADGYYNGDGSSFYVHSDHHDMKFIPGSNTLFSVNDGGIFRGDASAAPTVAWTDLSAKVHVTQYYSIGGTPHAAANLLCGAQDNDLTHFSSGSLVSRNAGSDGVEGLWDHTDATSQKAWTGSQTGHFWRTTNGFTSTQYLKLDAPFVWELEISTDGNTLYAGLNSDVAKSTDGGATWTNMNSGIFAAIEFISIAPSDPNTIYISAGTAIRKTTNGGTSWTDITLPTSGSVKSIEVHPTNPNEIYLAYAGYGAGNRVFKSTNGGTSFTNISGSLPNVPTHQIRYKTGSTTGELFIGTDVGVYYWTSTTGDWVKLGTGLPNVIVNDIDIHYNSNKLRVATYGRGVWEFDINTLNIADQQLDEDSLLVHPNPSTNGHFNIELKGLNDVSSITIYNIIGGVLSHFETHNKNIPINLSKAANGVYFVHVNNKGKSTVKKIIVSK